MATKRSLPVPLAAAPRATEAQGPTKPSTDATDSAALLEAVRALLKEDMSAFSYNGYIAPLMPGPLSFYLKGETERLSWQLYATTAFLADWVTTHYGDELRARIAALLGRPTSSIDLRIVERPADTLPAGTLPADTLPAVVEPELPAARKKALPSGVVALQPRQSHQRPRLEPRYTFETFVTGPGSRMAYAAANSVAEKPGALYTPLFIFGSTGLGKTHLLHAAGHEILARHPHKRVALLSAEQWVNEFIESAHNKAFESFRRRFRDDVDVLLVDDIQFLAGKHQSQDEFFHTFNVLHEQHKQVIVTSDRYPHDIPGLEDRLKSRLQWGLVCDIKPPDVETRRQIIMRRAIDFGCALPQEVVDFVASSVSTSVRALEGALTRLVAWSQLTQEPVSLDEAREQLRGTLDAGKHSPMSVSRIIEVTARYFGMQPAALTGPSRERRTTRARQLAMYIARQRLQLSLPELGRAFGNRDHTTALASVRKVETLLGSDAGIQVEVQRLEQALF